MNDQRPRRTINRKTLYILLGSVLVIAAAGVAWATLGGHGAEVADTEEPTSTAEATTTSVPGSDDSTITASETTAALASVPEGGDADIPYNPSASPAVVDQMTGAVVGVSGAGGSYVLAIDFVQFLAGDEAVQAAKAHGGQVSQGGIYVLNDNPKVRELPIQEGVSVRVTVTPDGAPDQLGRVLSLKDWAAAVNGPAASAYKSGTYIVTITNGAVTALEQLYLP